MVIRHAGHHALRAAHDGSLSVASGQQRRRTPAGVVHHRAAPSGGRPWTAATHRRSATRSSPPAPSHAVQIRTSDAPPGPGRAGLRQDPAWFGLGDLHPVLQAGPPALALNRAIVRAPTPPDSTWKSENAGDRNAGGACALPRHSGRPFRRRTRRALSGDQNPRYADLSITAG